MWWREWTHEEEGRRGENVCGGESGHMRGRGGGQMRGMREWTHEEEGRRGANVCGGESGHMRGWTHEGDGRRGQSLTERMDT